MWSRLDDGSVIDDNGKLIFFSTQRFVNDICLGHCCFICGAAPSSVPFNDEHVIPEWVLRRFGLFSKSIRTVSEFDMTNTRCRAVRLATR
jgi:hypothetical protein